MSGALLNYTTSIDAGKTAGEIIGLLAAHGARRIETLYDQGLCVGIAVGIDVNSKELGFRLPVNADATLETLKLHQRQGKVAPRYVNKEQANRISWRILKDWTEAQLALVETGMVKTEEVFLPYLLDNQDRPLFKVMEQQWLALPDGGK